MECLYCYGTSSLLKYAREGLMDSEYPEFRNADWEIRIPHLEIVIRRITSCRMATPKVAE